MLQPDAMTELYPMYQVDPNWMIDPESMGSKQKFWYRNPDDYSGSAWLFKYPRSNSGEHWAEKIAAEIAQALDIPHSRVELAVCQEAKGSTSESFTESHWELFHGNQLLEKVVESYNLAEVRRPPQHTLSNIFEVLSSLPDAVNQFAEYLILDALIGNTDRHHENWGVLMADEGRQRKLAPSFDHASSLGRDIADEARGRRLQEGTVGAYVERGRGGIYWLEQDARTPSPLELVRRAVREYPVAFARGLANLAQLDEADILAAINRIPEDWMTETQRSFSTEMVRYSLAELRRLN